MRNVPAVAALAALAAGLTAAGAASAQASPAWRAGPAVVAGWHIRTVAGGLGGPGPAGEFAADDCAVTAAGGSVYASGPDGVIRRISASTGQLSPVAGSGLGGFEPGAIPDGSAAANPRIGNACGLAVDHHGNLIFADSAHFPPGPRHGTRSEAIEVLPPAAGTFYGQAMKAGHIYRIAGDGTAGFAGDGGPAIDAELDGPAGLAVDAAGNIAVADMDNDRVRVIAEHTGTFYGQSMTAGDIYTVAGGGAGGIGDGGLAANATLGLTPPRGGIVQYKSTLWPVVALDQAGNIVLADVTDARIRVIARNNGTFYGQAMTAGHIYTVAGGGTQPLGDSGPATQIMLGWPSGVAVDGSGNVIFSDPDSERVRVLADSAGLFYGQSMQAGFVYTLAGNGFAGFGGDGGPASSAEFTGPAGVSVDSAGNVIIADGQGVSGVTFRDNMRLRVVAAKTGTFYGVAMKAGDIYTVSGPRTSFLGNGAAATAAVLGVVRPLEGSPPGGIAVSKSGALVVADLAHDQVRMVPVTTGRYFGQRMLAGRIYPVAGTGVSGYSGDGGLAIKAKVNRLTGLAFDHAGNLLVAGATTIRVVAVRSAVFYGQPMTTGHIYTIAGNGKNGGTGDGGIARAARLSNPSGIAVDAHGNVLACVRGPAVDPEDGRIRIIAERTGTFYGQHMATGHIYPFAHESCDSLVVDSNGNVLFSTDIFGQVRRVEVIAARSGRFYGQAMTAGHVYTVAGGGQLRHIGDGGPATKAFVDPSDITLDRAGNIVIADLANTRVRVVAVSTGRFYGRAMTAGDIYPIAGGRATGGLGDGGAATAARLVSPLGVAVTSSGAIMVADGTRIREIAG